MKPIDIARAERVVYQCSNCGERESRVIDHDKTSEATRRRRQCFNCGHRETTYEIPQERYFELKKAYTDLEAICKILKTVKPVKKKTTLTCNKCIHMEKGKCFFEFPDAGGAFAEECSLFTTEKELIK